MNGDSRETGKLTPEGLPDPSVFSTDRNREGIRLGTAVGLLARSKGDAGEVDVLYREFWGAGKLDQLLADGVEYATSGPEKANRYSFRPTAVDALYLRWPLVTELAGIAPVSGLQEMRRGALMDIDEERLRERIDAYFDASRSWSDIEQMHQGLASNAGSFDAEKSWKKAAGSEGALHGQFRRYSLMPFDNRFCYWTATVLWNRPRPALVDQAWPGNRFFVVRPAAERPHEWIPATVTSCLPDYHLLRPNVVAIPMELSSHEARGHQLTMQPDPGQPKENLSAAAKAYLGDLSIDSTERSAEQGLVWFHAAAVCHSSTYLRDNGQGVRADYPRIPLPANSDVLLASAGLGRTVAALLDVEEPVEAVTAGYIRRELRAIGAIANADDRQLDPSADDLALTAGWGHAGQSGITMPGRGRAIERPYADLELATVREGISDLGLTYDQLLACLGETCYDVYLNDVAFWRCVPSRVWKYTIGGYQVMKKWLSYRERSLLGRDLKPEEARYVTEMARRIAALLLLEPALDANYERVKADTFPWAQATRPGQEIAPPGPS